MIAATETAIVGGAPVARRTFTADEIALMRRTIGQEASDDDFDIFVRTAERTGLDPFARQIYLSKRREKDDHNDRWITRHQPLVSIDGFRLIAERTGEYEGQTRPEWCGIDGDWKDVWLKKQPPAAARVGVWRKGFREPLYAVARFDAFVQTKRDGTPNSMWAKMGDNQLRKCAEALALRQAFPQDLSGLYTGDEMAQASNAAPEEDDTRAEGRTPPRRAEAVKPAAAPSPYDVDPDALTVEEALALPLPGPEGSWGGKAGNPLGTFGPKALGQINDHFRDRTDADPELAALMLTACKLIANHRELRSLETDGAERAAAEDEQRQRPTAGSSPSATSSSSTSGSATGDSASTGSSSASTSASAISAASPTGSASATTSAPAPDPAAQAAARVEAAERRTAAADPDSTIALTKQLRALLAHPGIDNVARGRALRDLDTGKLRAPLKLQQVIAYWTRVIAELDPPTPAAARRGAVDDIPF